MTSTEPDGLIPLGRTGWQVWRSAVLRGAGFPASGLDRLGAPECAKVADVYLMGGVDRAEFLAAFDTATGEITAQLCDIAANPVFREAVTWQNTGVLHQLDWLARTGPDTPRNSRLRQVEIVITRYWQRYCGKNDTIGFFGPLCWVGFDPDGPPVRATLGSGLVRDRVVDLEWRVLTAFAGTLAADPRYRPWLPVRRQPHLALDGNRLLRIGARPQELSAAAAALLEAADGTRSARQLAARVIDSGTSGLRKESDAFLILEQLAEQDLLRWGLSLPLSIAAEHRLRESLAAIEDPVLRAEASARLEPLLAARDELAAAGGDSVAVGAAMRRLEDLSVELTGGPAKHRPGATYAGRGVAYEDTTRDLDLTFGAPVLDALAPALAPLLQAARWLTAALAEVGETVSRELFSDAGTDTVPLGELWVLARGALLSDGPATSVLAEFTRRWSKLLGLDRAGGGRVTVDSAELAILVDEAFPAETPGWSGGRLHSPDLQLCAESVDALARGEFTAVLGELHAAWVTCDGGFFTRFHPEPDAIRAALRRDLGDRILLLYPPDFPELTARGVSLLDNPGDFRLAFAAAPTPTLAGVLPIAGLNVSLVDDRLVARAPDGRTWPLLELLGPVLAELAVNAFSLAGAGRHTPRVTVDRLVLLRETWRTTIGESGLAVQPKSAGDRYLAVRRWREELGLPERVFVRVGTEIKPCYVDFTSPAYVAAFLAMLRSAHGTAGDGVRLSISELLPDPDQAWLTDADGLRYFSELRLTVRDPMPANTTRGAVDG
jgi:hypothetical protein